MSQSSSTIYRGRRVWWRAGGCRWEGVYTRTLELQYHSELGAEPLAQVMGARCIEGKGEDIPANKEVHVAFSKLELPPYYKPGPALVDLGLSIPVKVHLTGNTRVDTTSLKYECTFPKGATFYINESDIQPVPEHMGTGYDWEDDDTYDITEDEYAKDEYVAYRLVYLK